MKKILGGIILVIIILSLLGISGLLVYNAVNAKTEDVKNPILNLELEEYGTIKIELYPDYAPNTVKNIIALANNGYYNGKIFYGIDDIAVYVGRNSEGDSENPKLSNIKTLDDGEDDYDYSINGEFIANGFKENTLKHSKGVVSMVRANYSNQIESLTNESYNSATSQFTIIMNDNARNLNGMYAAFGKVIEGMDILEQIYELDIKVEETEEDVSSDDSIKAFAEAPVITNATVETYGINYELPETSEAFDYSEYMNNLMNQYYSYNNN